MGKINEALVEVNEIESFMRRRYLYNHPIFAHITRAVELLEAEVAAQIPPAELEEMAVAVPDLEPNDGTDGELPPIEEAATAETIQPDIEVPPEAPKRRNRRRKGTRT